MRTIICTTGTSIAMGVRWQGQERPYRAAVKKRIRGLEEAAVGTFLQRASAESNSLERLDVAGQDRVALLHSETPDGQICAEAVKVLIEEQLGITSTLHRIAGLQVMDAQQFRRAGIQNLFAAVDRIVKQSPLQSEVILNATGGFKSVVPYLTLYGLLNRLPVVYIFERSNALITLPPAPIHFDYERLSQARDALIRLQDQGVMRKEDFFEAIPSLPYAERSWYEALLEEDEEGYIAPSAFAAMFYEQLQREVSEVRISKRAKEAYQAATGVAKDQFTFMLERVANPLFRQANLHTFKGSGLAIYKPGNTAQRMGYLVRANIIYVCELWADHAVYEREAGQRSEKDYDLGRFDPWIRPPDVEEPPATEEEAFRRLHARAVRMEGQAREFESLWASSERHLSDTKLESVALKNKVGVLEEGLKVESAKSDRLAEERHGLEQQLARRRIPWWRRLLGTQCSE